MIGDSSLHKWLFIHAAKLFFLLWISLEFIFLTLNKQTKNLPKCDIFLGDCVVVVVVVVVGTVVFTSGPENWKINNQKLIQRNLDNQNLVQKYMNWNM